MEIPESKDIPESFRLEFSEKFSPNKFALSEADDNNSRPLKRGGIAEPLLRTLLAIYQNSQELSFWEVTDSCFSTIHKFGSFKAMHMCGRILSEDKPSLRNCLNQLNHPGLFHTEQESQESLIQGKIHYQQNLGKGLQYPLS